jgi:hypothetical protein
MEYTREQLADKIVDLLNDNTQGPQEALDVLSLVLKALGTGKV